MSQDLFVKNGIVIPGHELHITASRAGGPGGQHVNKTSTRISVRWNVKNTRALTDLQKERVLEKLASELTHEGEIIVHNSESRSQLQNKKNALDHLAKKIRNALRVPKQRMETTVSRTVKMARVQDKKKRGAVKKMRSKKIMSDD